jgi:hypothetical protein
MTESMPGSSPSLLRHKRQFWWQILLPVLLAALLGLAAAVLAVFFSLSGGSQTRLWADISIIWLVTPLLALAMIVGVILVILILGLDRLTRLLPRYISLTQGFFARAATGVERIANRVARPVLWIRQAGAALRSVLSIRLGRK